MEEIWERCKPEIEISEKYNVETVLDNLKGLSIILTDSENEVLKIEIIFDNLVHAYRSTDEIYRQKTINYIDENYGTEFYSEWTLFKVSNSAYIEWICNQFYGIAESDILTHFSIVAVDCIIDIIATYEPKVEIYK